MPRIPSRSAWANSSSRICQFSSSAPHRKALSFSLKPISLEEHSSGQPLRMLMFGKPVRVMSDDQKFVRLMERIHKGSGKGTLSTMLTQKYDINFLSTGDILRHEIAEGTEIGKVGEEIVAKGGLLPDDVMIRMISGKLDVLTDKHWILDGFPRTLGQGELLDAHLRNTGQPLSLIVNLDVPDEVILDRISDRWVHVPSGRVYNLSYNLPKVEGRDDITGEPLTKRPDDNPQIFARRLKKFYESTSPLITYFTSRASPSTKLVTLSGKTSDEIWPQLEEVVASFPIRPRTETRVETREREREKSIRESIGLNIPPDRNRHLTKKPSV